MTLSTSVNKTSDAGNGSTTAFSFPYLFFANDDLVVTLVVDSTGVETTQTITTNYTVAGAGNTAGGTVTMVTAPATGETLVIQRIEQFTQGLDLVENDPMPSDNTEKQFDILTMLTQQLDEGLGRSLKLPASNTGSGVLGPITANHLLTVNSTSDGFTMLDPASLSSAVVFKNMTVDTFNGTGSQTSFTLSSDPVNEGNTLVTIDGVVQHKATYSLSGTTLTFSTAPPSGTANIEVTHGQASTEAGPTGATGATGPTGSTGATGAVGPSFGLDMTFETTTTDTDQGAGKVWLNNSTPASATVLYMDDVTAAATNINTFVDTWDDSTTNAGNQGTIIITKDSAPTFFHIFTINQGTSVTSASTYSKIAVTHVAGNASNFTDADAVHVWFSATGSAGSGLASVVNDTTPQLGGFLDTNSKFASFSQGANIASVAGDTDIWANYDGNTVHITGTNAITDFGTPKQAGDFMWVIFDDAASVVDSATITVDGNANFQAAANDLALVYALTTSTFLFKPFPNAVRPVSLGGTGAATLTDGGILLGSGTGAITPMAVLGDGAIVVGDGTTDPVALTAFSSSTGNLLGTKGGTIGQQTIWMPAGAMEPAASTAPAVSNVVEIGTSLFAARTMDFADGSDLYCYFGIQMPKSWDAGALVLQFVWSATGTNANTVAWGASAISLGDNEVLTTAFAAPTVAAADTNSTTADDIMISEEVSVTVGNSPAAEDYVMFEIMRDISADTLAEAARLHGIKIHYTIDTGVDT